MMSITSMVNQYSDLWRKSLGLGKPITNKTGGSYD
ncbi:helicase/SNF2 superfamily [Legionella pneumophila subsp. pneumophila str. Philadelphia 1]|uniref:Helicase/SNF2 superfamily n=1 Tax=Legionella pneumophila subsp. pneumophila (strain Philadelphia 1 / ATCC 33152 / DSM 7513) TaxID=272624 RepID=Q5ZXJ5_LEGPH|nr:helicase/SNF2 superfamily [Legionella pneumophila subsp. pneumophila str. Philadelphia 1]